MYKEYAEVIYNVMKVMSEVIVEKGESGFGWGWPCMDSVITVKQHFEKKRWLNFGVHVTFLDLEKVVYRVDRETYGPLQNNIALNTEKSNSKPIQKDSSDFRIR